MKAQLHQLQLVYPPLSNQEAEWMRTSDEAGLRERLSRSNLYMIGRRAEARYVDIAANPETGLASARYVVPGVADTAFEIDFMRLADVAGLKFDFDLEMGPKLIRA